MDSEQARAERRALGEKALGIFRPEEVTGLAESKVDELFHWDAAFLGLNETILGFKVKPLCARHLVFLSVVQSPFLINVPMEFFCVLPGIDIHIKRFMWIVSPTFKPQSRIRRNLFFLAYRLFAWQKLDTAVKAILDYINEAMRDYAKSGSKENFCSCAADTVHFLCNEYHFTMEQALDCPLKIVFQLAQCSRRSKGIKISKRSDTIISEWLAEENKKLLNRN
jgi:hypothetical protein